MPNVDVAVRLLTTACTDLFSNSSLNYKRNIINQFLSLPNDNIPVEFRNKSVNVIEKVFLNLNSRIRETLEGVFECNILSIRNDSSNNQKGSDLIIICDYGRTKRVERIELKFGKETLRAIGLKTFDSIFVVDFDNDFFTDAFNTIRENQKLFADAYPRDINGLLNNLHSQLESFCEELNELKDDGALYINSNEMELQLSGTGSISENTGTFPAFKFIIGISHIEVTEALDFSGNWEIIDIYTSRQDGARLTFIASNGLVESKFLLHWKNDYFYNGFRYPAKTGLISYCFNVWARRL